MCGNFNYDGRVPERFDVAVIGGGIVGLATARAILERAQNIRLALIEKEPKLATHQTGHNSGVIHSGLYYKQGSAKARLSVEGGRLLQEFCAQHGVRVVRCGKVIVATRPSELPGLQALYERGRANGVPVELIEPTRLRELEPHAFALRAIHSPATGIVDYTEVAAAMGRELQAAGAIVRTGTRVIDIEQTGDGFELGTPTGSIRCARLVNCAGLHCDSVARLAGATPDVRIVPFRGEYYTLRPERRHLVRSLIYPVPDAAFPFLGVHFTTTVHGDVEAGPNAVLAFAREGYRFGDVNVRDLAGMLTSPGFWAMASRHWRTGSVEMVRSLSKAAFVTALQRLVPDVRADDIVRGESGVRAQAVAADGRLLDDFHIATEGNAIHVLNAPSPAATASLAIGRHVASLAAERFGLR